MRNAATQVIADLVATNPYVIAIAADQGNEIYESIKRSHPAQYIDYGIAESNMLASAAGLAAEGFIPCIYTLTNFMSMRGFEFIRNIVCYPKYNVKFLGRSFGLASSHLGMTHQGTEDFAILRTLENLCVIYPATPIEAREATRFACAHQGPVYICLEGSNEPELFDDSYTFNLNKASLLREGDDITFITMGSIANEALAAANMLQEKLQARVISVSVVKPIDSELILRAARETKGIITIEEQTIYGGLGSAVAEVLVEHSVATSFTRMGLHGFTRHAATRALMRKHYGLDAQHIADTACRMLKK